MLKLYRSILGALAGLALMAGTARTASAQAVQTVDADINSALSVSISTAFAPTPWLLSQGANTNSSMVLTALANIPYHLQVSCDTSATKGALANRLFEYNSGAYVAAGKYINAPAKIRALGAGAAADITTTATGLTNATTQAQSGVGGRTHSVEVSQFIDFGDSSLSGSSSSNTSAYHMVITFTIISAAV
ncbi:MAG: hypothetical protein HY698_08450 [Deltaproteobacteria bacterium]|nr:hypothetical protein [Deltaproteobacteria bacterium]